MESNRMNNEHVGVTPRKSRLWKLAAGMAGVVVAVGVAWGAGMFPALPLASQSVLTMPLTGNETIPADTNLGQGINPATELLTPGMLGAGPYAGTFRNSLIGAGDFAFNLWQRGTSFTGITNTAKYTADRWAAIGGASSSVSISEQTGAADIPVGFGASMRVQRASTNTATSQICVGQPVITANSLRYQGAEVTYSFYAYAPTTFSASGYTVNAYLVYGTGTNGSMANMFAGSWTGFATAVPIQAGSDVLGASYSSTVSGAAAIQFNSGSTTANAGIPLNSTWHRYWVAYKLPATETQVGVELCFTPTGTAGTADYFEFTGAQLEGNSSGVPTTVERLSSDVTAGQQVAYYYNIAESSTSGALQSVAGYYTSSTVCSILFSFPGPMWQAPTYTNALSGTTFKIVPATTPVVLASPYSALQAGSATTVAAVLNFTTTTETANTACELVSAAGSGSIAFSAEL